MPALARGQENQTSILNWFITVNGILTDANYVGYRIFDITGGLPGTQIFPATPGNYEEVTPVPGKFGTGSYYAYDNENDVGFTPSLTASIGTHRIEWRWRISGGAPHQGGFEDFEVLVQSGGSTADTYITIQDVRDAGLGAGDFPDTLVLSTIEIWQAFLDRACRQWFLPRSIIMELDGTDSEILHLGVPIISIDYIQINSSGANLGTTYYRVYASRTFPDDRRNPRIKLVNNYIADIFTSTDPSCQLIFRQGYKNQVVKGTFGFVELDGNPPLLIQRALLKLVVEKLSSPVYPSGGGGGGLPPIVGSLEEEWTDGHRVVYGAAGGKSSSRPPGLLGITNDPEVLGIIKLYKSPIALAYPVNPSIL